MSDDLSLFDRRMRKPAAISLTVGFALGIMSVQAQRLSYSGDYPWTLALIYGPLAAAMLYGVTYRNLSKRLEHESRAEDN